MYIVDPWQVDKDKWIVCFDGHITHQAKMSDKSFKTLGYDLLI